MINSKPGIYLKYFTWYFLLNTGLIRKTNLIRLSSIHTPFFSVSVYANSHRTIHSPSLADYIGTKAYLELHYSLFHRDNFIKVYRRNRFPNSKRQIFIDDTSKWTQDEIIRDIIIADGEKVMRLYLVFCEWNICCGVWYGCHHPETSIWKKTPLYVDF